MNFHFTLFPSFFFSFLFLSIFCYKLFFFFVFDITMKFQPKIANAVNITTAVPDHLFDQIKRSNVVKFMKACKEINIAFIPYEAQVNFPYFLLKFTLTLKLMECLCHICHCECMYSTIESLYSRTSIAVVLNYQ